MSTETTECDVCDELFNKSTRSKVFCRACETSCCKSCVRKYVGRTIKDAHCMNCQASWDRGFLVDNLNKSFVDGLYSDTRKKVLFQREQARFPETMEHVKVLRKKLEYQDMNSKIYTLRSKYQRLLNTINLVKKTDENPDIFEKIEGYIVELKDLLIEIKESEHIRDTLKDELKKVGIIKERNVSFIHACSKEGCKGFLSTAWKCGLCDNWTCPKCFELKGHLKDDPNNPHVCKEENIQSADLIRKETKNCPKCAVPIFKISGCDQMFCTVCRIAFSWRTGEIDNGTIHNPHYFQAQREINQHLNAEQRQNLQENANRNLCGPCGDDNMPNWYLYQGIIRKLRDDKIITQQQYTWVFALFRQVGHLNGAIMNPMRMECRRFQDQRDLRAKYILSRISKDQFEQELVQNDSIFKRNISCLQIYDLLITFFRESINKISEERSGLSVIEAQEHIKRISDYANRELARLSYIYSKSIDLFKFKYCSFEGVRFTKNSYMALKNSGMRHPSIQHPLKRMNAITKATTKYLRSWNYTLRKWTEPCCPQCKEQIQVPYYTSSWNNWRAATICIKCLFTQENKDKQLIKALEEEERDLIRYYTAKKDKLDYIKTSIKDWAKKINESNDKHSGGGSKD